MSSSLKWRVRSDWRGQFDTQLKFILREKYGEPVDHIFTDIDLDFLEGLNAAGVKDAKVLIDAINQFKEIEVNEI